MGGQYLSRFYKKAYLVGPRGQTGLTGPQGTPGEDALEFFNVKSFGAVGDGATDDAASIQDALDNATAGSTVFLPPGIYGISIPIVIPPNVTLLGQQGRRVINSTETTTLSMIKPLSGFSGVAALRLLDKEQGGYSANSNGQRIRHLTLHGGNTTGSVMGLKAEGFVHDVLLENIAFYKFAGNGLTTTTYVRADTSTVFPYSWTMMNVISQENGGIGFLLNKLTDTMFVNVQALGNGSHGWSMTDLANSTLTSCRAEWSGNHGFYITGAWNTGTGSGGMQMSNCSTDRNDKNGCLIDATGTQPIIINNLMTRRDGRNAGAGGGAYAGLNANTATVKVIVNNVSCFPGVDDDGTQSPSPAYGASFTGNNLVVVTSGYLHGVTSGWNDSGTNTTLRRGPNLVTASGSTASPTISLSNDWNSNGQQNIDLTGADVTGLKITNTQGNDSGPMIYTLAHEATGRVFNASVSGDNTNRFNVLADGNMTWGPGNASRDTNLYRSAADTLKTDDTFIAGTGMKIGSTALYPRTRTGIGKISGGATQWGFPNTLFFSVGTSSLTINTVRYVPMIIEYAVTLTAWLLEVTSAPASNANLRVGLYLADANMQPSGAALYDSNSVSVASGFTGTKTATGLSVALTPGVYLMALNCDVTMTIRTFISGSPVIVAALGTSPMSQRFEASQTYGAYPNPGTAWTSTNASAGGQQNFAVWQWTE